MTLKWLTNTHIREARALAETLNAKIGAPQATKEHSIVELLGLGMVGLWREDPREAEALFEGPSTKWADLKIEAVDWALAQAAKGRPVVRWIARHAGGRSSIRGYACAEGFDPAMASLDDPA